MSSQYNDFQRRVVQINSTHTRRVPYSFRMRPDGLLVPSTRSRLRFRFPWRGILAGAMTVIAAKAFMIGYLGEEIYLQRLDTVLAGGSYEQTAHAVLAPDPVSSWVAAQAKAGLTALADL